MSTHANCLPFLKKQAPIAGDINMVVPKLPKEVWFRISTHLAPPELSSLSQVNKTLHRLATDEHHFERLLVIPQPRTSHFCTAYRRQRAFLHPPTASALPISSKTDMFCVAEDTLILIDKATARLISFPGGKTANIADLLGNAAHTREGRLSVRLARRQITILPGAHIAFLKGSDPTILTVVEVNTWNMKKHVIPGKRCASQSILKGWDESSVCAAGNHGEWIIYHVDEDNAVLVDWRQGTVVRSVECTADDVRVKWLTGTNPATNDRTVVGVLHESKDTQNFQVRAKGFDGAERNFRFAGPREIFSIARSADAQTYLLLTSCQGTGFLAPPQYNVHRALTDSVQTWEGLILPWPNTLINEDVIESIPPPIMKLCRGESETNSQQLFVVLGEDRSDGQFWTPTRDFRCHVVWSRLTSDGGLAVLGSSSAGCVEVSRLRWLSMEPLNSIVSPVYAEEEEKPLHHFSVTGLTNLCVLADHIIIATRADANLEVLHFDRFCREDGAYACSLMRTIPAFRFPAASRLEAADKPALKKRGRSGPQSLVRYNMH